MNHKGFISNVYNTTYAIARMKCCTRAWIILDCPVIIAMLDLLQRESYL